MPSVEELEIQRLKKRIREMEYKMEHLEKFIFLDEEPLRKLYETYKKIEEGKGRPGNVIATGPDSDK